LHHTQHGRQPFEVSDYDDRALGLVAPRADTVKRPVRIDIAELSHPVLRLLDFAETPLHSRGRPLGTDSVGVGYVEIDD
jgi:hypothetical protein